MRRTPSRPHEETGDPYTDFVKDRFGGAFPLMPQARLSALSCRAMPADAVISPALVFLFGVLGIGLGALVAFLLVRKGVSLVPLAIPVLSLLVTLRPLVLPILAGVVVGLFNLGGLVLLIGAALLSFVALWLFVLPERDQLHRVDTWDQPLVHGARTVLALLLVGFAALGSALGSERSLESIGGPAAILLILALALWLLAFGLRLISHASSRLRAAVALVVVLAGFRLGAFLGLVPFGDFIADHLSFVDWLLPVLLLVLIAVEGVLDAIAAARGEDPKAAVPTADLPPLVRRIRRGGLGGASVGLFQGLGLALTLLSAATLLFSAWIGLGETDQPGARTTTDRAVPAEEAKPPPAPSSYGDDEALAAAYAPVLSLTRDERWSPIAYDEYAEEATLSGPMPRPPPKGASAAEKLTTNCPRLASTPCFRLSIHCPNGEADCNGHDEHPDRGDAGLFKEGDVYVRVARRGVEEKLEEQRNVEHVRQSDRWPAKVFRPEGPYAKQLSILLQYWYFYRYDEWETHVFAGKLVQRHEGDWEAVTIGLSDTEPLFVAYSAHCAGTWVPWEEAEISKQLGGRTHPVVAVAEGSHANYPRAGQKRSPDWAGCQGAPAGTTTLLSYASNIRDKTEYGWEWYPEEGGIHVVSETEAPMSFPGYWGAGESTTLYGFFKTTKLGEGHGPETPSEQPLWRTPVTKIFCGNYSQPQLPGSVPHHYCPESAKQSESEG